MPTAPGSNAPRATCPATCRTGTTAPTGLALTITGRRSEAGIARAARGPRNLWETAAFWPPFSFGFIGQARLDFDLWYGSLHKTGDFALRRALEYRCHGLRSKGRLKRDVDSTNCCKIRLLVRIRHV